MKSNLKIIQILHDELIANGFKLILHDSYLEFEKAKKFSINLGFDKATWVFYEEQIFASGDIIADLKIGKIKYNSSKSINPILEVAECERIT